MSNFKIGQKVVCVDITDCVSPLVLGGIYTIARFSPDSGIILKEVKAYYHQLGFGFKEHRFKPLDESFAEEVEANIAKWLRMNKWLKFNSIDNQCIDNQIIFC